ncbi:MAG TPA: leucyl/phenylalanyl-tRNA--protein transferase [Bacteroidota bacterium]|nr:leucyl/phenylalanyl-tRNA--protein transferase [Bacteroidota bacterium]
MSNRNSTVELIDPQFLLNAYSIGYFPMAESREGPISWHSPDPRGIFELERFNIPRSLEQTIRKNLFEVRVDRAFEETMRACAARDETWISETIIRSYCKLFELGFAHSVESWKDGKLAGGLYGVCLGAAFFGESMFSTAADASKVSLVHLVERLRSRDFRLLDTQFVTPHLARFGAVEISREAYLRRLNEALALTRSFS